MRISNHYNWLAELPGLPKMIQEGIKLGKLDTNELPGAKSNAEIMKLAKEAGVEKIYKIDETPWCGVGMVAVALRAGKKIVFGLWERLRAASFLNFGTPVAEPMLGDVCVFDRPGGKHVGMYAGEDAKAYHIMGGNQGNQWSIVRIAKDRLEGARRPEYKTGVPAAVKKYFLNELGQLLLPGAAPAGGGQLSQNEQ